jgi:hypothetical protein
MDYDATDIPVLTIAAVITGPKSSSFEWTFVSSSVVNHPLLAQLGGVLISTLRSSASLR